MSIHLRSKVGLGLRCEAIPTKYVFCVDHSGLEPEVLGVVVVAKKEDLTIMKKKKSGWFMFQNVFR